MKWFQFATRVLPFVVAAVHGAELAGAALKGPEKQGLAVEMVKAAVAASDTAGGREVLDDPLVEQALRQLIDAIVALHNEVAMSITPAPAS